MSVYYVIYPDKTVKEVMADFAEETKNTIAFLVRDKEKGENTPVFTAMLKHILLWSKKQ